MGTITKNSKILLGQKFSLTKFYLLTCSKSLRFSGAKVTHSGGSTEFSFKLLNNSFCCLVTSSGLLVDATQPIIPDMECPTKTTDFKFISSNKVIKSSAKASKVEYLTGSNSVGSLTDPEKAQSKRTTRHRWVRKGTILSHTDWSVPNPWARTTVSVPEPMVRAFMAVERERSFPTITMFGSWI